jgi:YhcH/YjgK/YiaL family protein
MFVANIHHEEVWRTVFNHPVFIESLNWIKDNSKIKQEGIYTLAEEGWYVNVHAYETKPEVNCQWENHSKTIDIQYIIEGAEKIRWCSTYELGKIIAYHENTDTQRFELNNTHANSFILTENMFAIFFPGDAHCPQIAASEPSWLKKLVVKIPLHLVQ